MAMRRRKLEDIRTQNIQVGLGIKNTPSRRQPVRSGDIISIKSADDISNTELQSIVKSRTETLIIAEPTYLKKSI
jgi:hypothetical protein